MNKKTRWLAAAAVASLLVGCAAGPSTAMASTSATSASSPTQTPASGDLSAADQSAIGDTIKSWMLEPRCDLMTEEFLGEQVLHTFEGDPVKQCDSYKSLFVRKQYGRDDIRISDIKGNATEATAVGGDFHTNVTTNLTLVNNGAGWKIAKAA